MRKFLLFAFIVMSAITLRAQNCSDLFISEYNEGWSVNNAIELYNPTANEINLASYRIVRYSNGSTPPADSKYIAVLSGTIKPYRTKVLVRDARSSAGTAEVENGVVYEIWAALEAHGDVEGNSYLSPVYDTENTMFYNGDDVISLEKNDGGTWKFVDIFGKIGERPLNGANVSGGTGRNSGGWSAKSPYWRDHVSQQEIWSVDHALIRKKAIQKGVTDDLAPYFNPSTEWDSLSANTFTSLNWHECDCRPTNTKPVAAQALYTFNFNAQTAVVNDVIGSISATDANTDKLVYFIRSGNIYDPFKLNGNTGSLSVRKKEELKNTSYGITVSITDGTEPVFTYINLLESSATNNAPLFLDPIYSFSVAQNAAVGTEVGEVDASDMDYHRVVYTIVGGNTGNAFAVNNFGEITVAGTIGASPAQYTLQVAASDGFSATVKNVTVAVGGASNVEENKTDALRVFPNPATDVVNIDYAKGIQSVSIINMIGQKTYEQIYHSAKSISIPINGMQSGVYFIQIQTVSNETITHKLVIE